MIKHIFFTGFGFIVFFSLHSCTVSTPTEDKLTDSTKIVSTNGTLSEIIVALGLEDNIVGVDVASTFPASIREKPKIGHNRDISAEGVVALGTDLVLGITEMIKPEVAEQIRKSGGRLLLFDHDHSVEGARQLIRAVSDSLGLAAKGDSLLKAFEMGLAEAHSITEKFEDTPKVLFIYARGSGTMQVAGQETQIDKIISLAGGVNAVQGFTGFKPLTPESLVAANPDVILLFTSGLASLGGIEGLLEVQGVKETNAGKNSKVVEMDGQLLTGFGPRLGKAIAELAEQIR